MTVAIPVHHAGHKLQVLTRTVELQRPDKSVMLDGVFLLQLVSRPILELKAAMSYVLGSLPRGLRVLSLVFYWYCFLCCVLML